MVTLVAVALPDPVDIRLLTVLAETGRIAVHQLAAMVGIDPREAASRLVALSGNGLPLLVGVECDQRALYAMLAAYSSRPQSSKSGPYGYPSNAPQPSANADNGDQPTLRTGRQARVNAVGGTQYIMGSAGMQLAVKLVEVVDPADFLFTAAGYRLQPGERAVVVHTELTNQGPAPFTTIPDTNLVLVTDNGQVITKAPAPLSSRPPYRTGVAPGETIGGHTVYVLPETMTITGIRWSEQPNAYGNCLVWLADS